MIVSCPKCSAKTELDPSQIPETGGSAKCSACNSTYLVNRESIASRATRRGGEINCARCGQELGASLVCSSCGEMYPDYFVPETPEAVRQRRVRMMIDTISHLRDVSFEWGTSYTPTIDYRLKNRPATPKEKPASTGKPAVHVTPRRRYVTIAITLSVVALLLAGGLLYSKQAKAKQQYALNYVRALYLIKTGTDLSLKACSKISNDWKIKSQAGQSGVPHISAAEETALTKVKTEVDVYMQKTYEAPKPFAIARENLGSVQSAYLTLNSLAVSPPPGGLSAFTDSVNKAEADFRKSAKDLKANLPAYIAKELEKGALRHKALTEL